MTVQYLLTICRSGDVEEHVVEPAAKNKFLAELEQVDAAQLEQTVKSIVYLHYFWSHDI